MKWIELQEPGQLEEIRTKSYNQPQVIFKHSTRCSISSMAKSRLENAETPEGIEFYHLDLIRFRELSNQVAADFDVWHESPQVLLIENGECSYDESHIGITMPNLLDQLRG
ncbi:bacillithiol system redox-active protein YtxJ [Flavihumibacter solisilvae]|uniref:Bacillithiol system protein YtxJ n=1 Tax=Flavihumibacter solisilvae TaxID=1349421 RepID=A0A0C1KZ13_9BACT|nr:bacillithiol system redox-active protein YtxJ [Flavihumibacter solisilvae]KIC92932.1 bacillithiol system protein YtxJ [Flavihumibacter solisilvae]